MAERPPLRARARSQGPRRLLRPFACAAGRRPDAGFRRVLGGRPQRHGQDHAVQDHHGPAAGERRLGSRPRRGHHPPQPGADREAGVGYVPQGRRLWRSLSVAEHLSLAAGMRRGAWTIDRIYETFPAPCRTQGPWRRPALGRRTADAGDLARAADQPASADHGRADRRPGACHRRPGRGDAGAPRRRRRHVGARDRAEYRRRHGDLEERRDHGQWPGQPHHRLRAACRPTASCSNACSASAFTPRPSRKSKPTPTQAGARPAPHARREHGADPDLHLQSHAADALVAAGPDCAHRGRRAHAVDRRDADRRRCPAKARARPRKGVRPTRRPRRRHARHQGRGAALHSRRDRRTGLADAAGRRIHQRQTLHLRCLGPGNRAEPRPRRIKRVRVRPRRIGDGDGGRLCQLAAPPGQCRRHHFGGRLRRRLAGRARHARPSRRRAEADHLVGRVRRCRPLCGACRYHHDVFGHRRAGPQFDLARRARQWRQRHRRHGKGASRRSGQSSRRGRICRRSASPCSA